jgi:Zn-dependent peptidase ImmA (M78 family)
MINEYLEKNNIEVVEVDTYVLKGLYYNNTIYLSKYLTEEEKIYTILHEIGHIEKGVLLNLPFCDTYKQKCIRSKNEYKALKYVCDTILPKKEVNRYIQQNKDKYEVAEELCINLEDLEELAPFIERIIYDSNIC